ncbi:MAG: hypothetical protein J1F29_07345 [Lentimicrobiaceae bacterium]|nr:hypothetical protein [Lentimicrobiaceae bacterium]
MSGRGILLLFFAVFFSVCSCAPEPLPEKPEMVEEEPGGGNTADNGGEEGGEESGDNNQSEEAMTINITVGGKVFKADIEASETGRAFLAKLPLRLEMRELNGNEKYCYGVELPRADRYFNTIAAGDLMLYSGNCIVLFYGQAGGYSYTPIGKLQSAEGLAAALGKDSVSVIFEKE